MRLCELIAAVLTVMLLCALVTPAAAGKVTPVQVSIWHPAQLFDESYSVLLLRINLIYGRNRDVGIFDLGIVNSSEDLAGFQAGAVNIVDDSAFALQAGAINHVGFFLGVQAGGRNIVNGEFVGFQLGLLNYNRQRIAGIGAGIAGNIDESGFRATVTPSGWREFSID